MAREIYLLIQDNKVAEEFAKAMLVTERDGMPFVPRGTTIDAIVARPTLYCKCSSTKRKRGRQKPLDDFTQVKKFGWWVHALCNRPTKYVVEHWLENHIGGYRNLLSDLRKQRAGTDADKEDTNEGRRGSSAEEEGKRVP
jgi:hypothetical protein